MTTKQGQEILQEVKEMEQKVEEKAEVATPEPEQPVEETTLEAEQPEVISEVETPAEEIPVNLTEEVRAKLLACASEKDCIGALLGRFEQVASKLGIPTEKLIDQVFGLLQGEKIES